MSDSKTNIHDAEKNRMKYWIVLALIAVALAYLVFVFPPGVIAVAMGEENFLLEFGGRVFGAGVVGPLLSRVLFASDSLVKGHSSAAIWMRGLFASEAAVQRLKCSPNDAGALWFRYFDTWANPRSPNHELLKQTYRATYSARLVFYLKRALLIFLALTLVTVPINHWVFHAYTTTDGRARLGLHVVIFLAYLGTFSFLAVTNRIGDHPSGCWYRVKEVFTRSTVVFEQDVLNRTKSLKHAFGLVSEIDASLNEGARPI